MKTLIRYVVVRTWAAIRDVTSAVHANGDVTHRTMRKVFG